MARTLIPNSTQIPDVILDHWMAELSGCEFKVLLYIARRTYGFGKESDSISLSQIADGLKRRDGTTLDRGTGASRSSVARALKSLEERGLIIRKTNPSEKPGEFDENTYTINLAWEPGGGSTPHTRGGHGSGPPTRGVVRKSDHPPSERGGGWSQNETGGSPKIGLGWSQNETYKKQSQHTDQETASARTEPEPTDVADALFKELLSHGVGRSVARTLAKEKPALCRRYLDYLPHAAIRTTPGAWLANAIREEYGPPEGYERAVRAEESRSRVRPKGEKAPITPQDGHQAAILDRARRTYALLEQAAPDAITAFSEFLAEERERTGRFVGKLSTASKEKLIPEFESDEYRLRLFARWLDGEGRRFSARLSDPSDPGSPPQGGSTLDSEIGGTWRDSVGDKLGTTLPL